MKNIYIVLICLISLTACNREEWLDIKPKGIIIPQKVSDYRLLLDQSTITATSKSPGFVVSPANTDLMADEYQYDNPNVSSLLSDSEENMYLWNDNFFNPDQEDLDWQKLYGQIYVTNLVSEEIMNAEGSTDDKLTLLAEAKIHNAYAYFSLVNLYATHYNPATASSVLAVPFRKTTDLEDVKLPRATVKEIYDHVIENITSSIQYLPDSQANTTLKHRPAKVTAYAFLARVYLYMGDYEMALKYADMTLVLNNKLLNYNTVSNNPSFSILINMPQPQNNPEVIWLKKSALPYRTLILTQELYNLYESKDQRKRQFGPLSSLFGIAGNDQVFATSYFTTFRFCGFSVPETLLVRAECNARLNHLDAALADINYLRQNRIPASDYVALTSTSQSEVINIVLKQRRLELVGQSLRFFDIKRINQFHNANINLTHKYNGQTAELKANSKNWAVPIATKYILANPEIGENDRE
ncbi:RagB/SusD family nutrient uptake outer membrane protein [Flavobacterium pectinovorum]|uniref:RagB/SusD family nutrient uptake outer membrane protein n=1 Tax=Flavobacterium pectinovorum TaxID=29533 RepID=UPI001FAE48E1|nr:RagB/SusD family nutrient uptake outer membrane protein [Flavobacterium pectinovorum]MCI9845771.1 RagB/SusD family nutrient uptake outer membrane protein [Flavobacterium pectinovorum]